MLGPHQVVYDVAGRRVSPGVTEPELAHVTQHQRRGVVDAAVGARGRRHSLEAPSLRLVLVVVKVEIMGVESAMRFLQQVAKARLLEVVLGAQDLSIFRVAY